MKHFLVPDRSKYIYVLQTYDSLIPLTSEVRGIWAFCQKLSLSKFESKYKTLKGKPGRPAISPLLLLALWLVALTQGITSCRKITKKCSTDNEFKWLCAGIQVSYKTLNNFRSNHFQEIDALFTNGVQVCWADKLFDPSDVATDGTKTDLDVSVKSFLREDSLRKRLQMVVEKQEQLKGLNQSQREALGVGKYSAQEKVLREQRTRLTKVFEKFSSECPEGVVSFSSQLGLSPATHFVPFFRKVLRVI